MEPKNNTAYSGQPSSQPSGQLSSNSYGASPTGAKPNSPNSNKYRNWCIWGGLIIALLIVLGTYCYHIVTRDGAPVVVTDSLSPRLLQDSLSNNKTRIVQLTPEFIKAIEQYDELSLYSEGYAAVRKGELWGYIDTWGREVIPCKYSIALPFHEGLAAVGLPSSDGLSSIDTDFSRSYAVWFGRHRWAFIDTQGQVVIPPFDDYDMYLPGAFSEGRVVFISERLGHFTVVDRKGNVVLEDTYGEDTLLYRSVYTFPYEYPTVHVKYIDGKLYIPTDGVDYYRVYDTEGNRLKNVSREEKEKIEAVANAGKGMTFTRDIFSDSNGAYGGALYLWGLKDSHGKVLIPGGYDHVGIDIYPNSMYSENPIDLSNGVVPVALKEFEESKGLNLEGDRGFFYPGGGKTYYGYADLRGNDTFPKGLKERCKKARRRAIQEYLEKKKASEKEKEREGEIRRRGAEFPESRKADQLIRIISADEATEAW